MRLITCNVDAVFVTELNFRVYVLNAHNKSYDTHLKHVKTSLAKKNENRFVRKLGKKLHVHFSANSLKVKLPKTFPSF